MNPAHGVEERLRECACLGESDTVKLLVQRGVNVNAQHKINGWTALHWAACRGHREIVAYLLSQGADPSLLTRSGESAAQLCSYDDIQALLTNTVRTKDGSVTPTSSPVPIKSELPIIANYLQNPSFSYNAITSTTTTDTNGMSNGRNSSSPTKTMVTFGTELQALAVHSHPMSAQATANTSISGRALSIAGDREFLVKVRIANSGEEDFVEVELDRFDVTYESLLERCCEELDLSKSAVKKIRKLPNVLIRKDKDVQRLTDHQELEVVLLNRPIPNTFGIPTGEIH